MRGKLKDPIQLIWPDDDRIHWAKPSNLHDKIFRLVYHKHFEELLAKIRCKDQAEMMRMR